MAPHAPASKRRCSVCLVDRGAEADMRREKSEQQPNSIHAGGPGKRASRSRNKDPRRLPSPQQQPECSVSPAERKSQPRSESARHAERDSRKEEASRAKRKRCRRFVFRERRRAAKAAAAKRTHSRTPFPLRREDQPILPPSTLRTASQPACVPTTAWSEARAIYLSSIGERRRKGAAFWPWEASLDGLPRVDPHFSLPSGALLRNAAVRGRRPSSSFPASASSLLASTGRLLQSIWPVAIPVKHQVREAS